MALLDTQVAVLQPGDEYLVSGTIPNAWATPIPIRALSGFPASDGHIIIATGNDGQYRRICEVLGADELANDPRLPTTNSASSIATFSCR